MTIYDMPHWLATLLGVAAGTPRSLAQRDVVCTVHTQANVGWSAVLGQVAVSTAGLASADTAAPAPALAEQTGNVQADLSGFSAAA